MNLHAIACQKCDSKNHTILTIYATKCDGDRKLLKCMDCGECFSETKNTFLFNMKTPVSKIAMVLNARVEGMSFNAACRTYSIGTHTLQDWEKKFGSLKSTLMVYSLTHTFLDLVIEGDELYTKIHHNTEPHESEGWTVMLMDRASRFLWEFSCGEKNDSLFLPAIQTLIRVIEQTEDFTLVTDGEKRYGKILFDICNELVKTGKPGRPRKVLKKGVKVRIKNKGSQSHKKGPKLPKYQAPKPEHPETRQDVVNSDIHANHVEGQNAAIRRRISTFRRKANTYAKNIPGLQRVLDCYWVFHNFLKKHFTLDEVPAAKIGMIDSPFSWRSVFEIQVAFK
jgi:transposase-like protein